MRGIWHRTISAIVLAACTVAMTMYGYNGRVEAVDVDGLGVMTTVSSVLGFFGIETRQARLAAYEGDEELPPLEGEELAAAYKEAPDDLLFWYADADFSDFFYEAAMRYYGETGVKVALQYKDTTDYVGDVYAASIADEGMPDVYMLPGENLEEAYLYGLAAENGGAAAIGLAADNAVTASTYHDKLLGYPLSYSVCLFVCQDGYFETTPKSLQEILDFSVDNEPEEDVEYLFEWDVNDPFYDFPFIGNSVTFDKTDVNVMTVVYDDDLYARDLEFLEEITEYFSIDMDNVSEQDVIDNFLAGRTICAFLDAAKLSALSGYSYSMTQLPALNDELDAVGCATTELLAVNEFSEMPEEAAGFAEYATVEMAEELYNYSGHYSVICSAEPSAIEREAYAAYQAAVLAPDSQDARDFWVQLAETVASYFR